MNRSGMNLTPEERALIRDLKALGMSVVGIAACVKRSKSTVKRVLREASE